ncbi:glutathione S-transferase family protein [Cribrihabitans sp. XS_ASV171]
MYKIYGSPKSRAFRVLWLLEELGQPYTFEAVGPHDPEVLKVNPSGKIPVLVEGDTVLTDSTAIMTYLADKHGDFTYPAGTVERAQQDALTHMLLDEFDAVLWTAARHTFVLPEERRVPAVTASLAWEFGRNAERLADRFVGPYLMGEKMTVADILCVHCMGWARSVNFPIESEALKAYAKEVRSRPAFQKIAEMVR